MLSHYQYGHLLMFGLLLAATATDLRAHRIPNLISLGGLLLALLMAATGFGATGLVPALIGMAIGFLLLLPMYAKGAMGAGDVKLMMAVGAFVGGPALALAAVLATFIAGSVLGLGYMVASRGAGATVRRYASDIRIGVLGGGWKQALRPDHGSAPQRFPYAAAIASGAVVAVQFAEVWQRIWSGGS